MKHIMLIVGTRPNLVKAAALLDAMDGDPRFSIRFVHTGQHFDDNMSKAFFTDLQMRLPDAHLGVGDAGVLEQIAQILRLLETEVRSHPPDLMVVVGDVTSTMAAALAANKLSIPLAHVEAGLRSYDRSMPEEFNRRITDVLADYLFTTSREADQNLIREGVSAENIYFVGNVMVDTLLKHLDRARSLAAWRSFDVQPNAYTLLTLHRPSNVDDVQNLAKWVDLLNSLQQSLPVIFPVHPRTRLRLSKFGLDERLAAVPNIHLTPPLGYLEFLSLMAEARLVLTDSGGIQEETTILRVPCLTLRENTERPVTITEGSNRLVGTSPEKILQAVDSLLSSPPDKAYQVPEYWDGRAAYRIAEILANTGRGGSSLP